MRVIGCLTVVLLSGCFAQSSMPAPVHPITQSKALSVPVQSIKRLTSNQYRVKPGDTLMGIAFSHQRDFKALAAHNQIESPYEIYPDQVISLDTQPSALSRLTQSGAGALKHLKRRIEHFKHPSQAPVASTGESLLGPFSWKWPVAPDQARIRSDNELKAIQVALQPLSTIHASESGQVVFSGPLRGYGNLVLIQHDDSHITAYGFNQRLLVPVGRHVNKGAPIAHSSDKLLFQIRHHGKPIPAANTLASLSTTT